MENYIAFAKKYFDRVYFFLGCIAGILLVVILGLILLQVITRWANIVVLPGSIEYVGYAMAGSSFLCLPYALVNKEHIRVDLISSHTSGIARYLLTFWCYAISLAIASYFAYHSFQNVVISYQINDISQGEDATPLWIPQLVMPIGASFLCLALLDHFIRFLIIGSSELLDKPSKA